MTDDDFRVLLCLIEGDSTVFQVEAHINNTVIKLKVLIHQQKGKGILRDVDASDLILWKLKDPVAIRPSNTLAKRIQSLGNTFADIADKLDEFTDEMLDIFPQQPSQKALHIIVELPAAAAAPPKRQRTDDPDDPLAVIERWRSKRIKATLPAVIELRSLIDQPLPEDEKIPITLSRMHDLVSSRNEMRDICIMKDVELLFRASQVCSPLDKIFFAVLEAPPADGTEGSFHSFWDRNIRDVLELLVPRGKSIRNSGQHTSTRALRPDYAFILGERCPFRGEEKETGNNEDAKAELSTKLRWAYDPAPYVLGYYSTGPDLTLAAITPPLQRTQRPVVQDVANADLRLRRDRIKNIRRLINLAGLFPILADLIRNPGVEFQKMERDNSTVEMSGSNVIKKYTSEDAISRVQYIRKIYHLLSTKNVPNTDSLVHFFDKTVVLCPRGIDDMPKTEQELLEALICVLETLEALHRVPILFHRDIRWPNIVRSLDDPHKWFLIDWEDASSPPTKAQPHFAKGQHSPGIFSDGHGAEVDLWGVGQLIVRSNALGVSPRLREVGRWMQDVPVPSAQEALDKIKDYRNKQSL